MSKLKVSNLNISNSELLTDTESFLSELNENKSTLIKGGLQAEVPVWIPIQHWTLPVEPIVCFAPEDM